MSNRIAKNCLYFLFGFTVVLFAGKVFGAEIATEVYYNAKTKTKVAVLVESSDLSDYQSSVIYIKGNDDLGLNQEFCVSVYSEKINPPIEKYIDGSLNLDWKKLFLPSLIMMTSNKNEIF